MPHLFRKSAPAENISPEQAQEQIKALANVDETINKFEERLANVSRSHDLYRKRHTIVELRKKEVKKIMADKHRPYGKKMEQLQAMGRMLQESLSLIDEMQYLKKQIDSPGNDPAEHAPFKNHKDKKMREAAKKFIPAAQDVYKSSAEVVYAILEKQDLHNPKRKEELSLISNVIQHTGNLIKAPSQATVQPLLNDNQEISKKMGTPLWRRVLGAVTCVLGLTLAFAGIITLPMGAGFAAYGVGLAMYFGGAALLCISSNKEFSADQAARNLSHLGDQAAKLFPKKSAEEIELQPLAAKKSKMELPHFLSKKPSYRAPLKTGRN